ncbi:MAG: hypothetical protein ABIN58_09395 [candidate division WOR-3 bacterium]
MSVRLFVGNLPYDVTEPDLRELFAPVGQITSVIIPVDRETGKRRGFAFIEFSDSAQAEEATRRFHNQPFRGRNLTISEARARVSHTDSSSSTKSVHSLGIAGANRASHSAYGPKLSSRSPEFYPDLTEPSRSGRLERRNRNFGVDAKAFHKRKRNHAFKGETGFKKGPIRERLGGRIFGGYEDDDYDDELEFDYMSGFKEPEDDKEDVG